MSGSAIVVLCVTFLTLMMGNGMAQEANESPVTSIQGVALDVQAIQRLSEDALNGSGEAARRIATHYLVAQGNRKEALFWALIAAENGDVVGQYNAGFLLKDDPDSRNRQRAIFWLRRAADEGNEAAQKLLKEIAEK